ncbi:MAG: hypothetical protein AUJ47_05350 [Candidatus Marinimicrobia bacterium CG1_02_48_14]|nr:MAG: hypothetical protein AUJ47_05350 [Candidatus Marinimicrobia bacterium CG1_02_48_14]
MANRSGQTGNFNTNELIRLCREGDLVAFRELVMLYQGAAHSLARRFVGNREDAEDIVQETFVRVWRHLARFDLDKSFSTWLFRIITNLAYDVLRKRFKQNASITKWGDSIDFVNQESNTDDALQVAMTIRYKAARLPLKQQLVFVLRDLQELSVAEVARILQISENAVKVNLHHARHTIRVQLEQTGEAL